MRPQLLGRAARFIVTLAVGAVSLPAVLPAMAAGAAAVTYDTDKVFARDLRNLALLRKNCCEPSAVFQKARTG